MKRTDFLVAISIGRGTRYFGEALLAAWYGEAVLRRIEAFVHDHTLLTVAVALVIFGGLGVWIWRRQEPPAVDGDTRSSV